MSRTVFTNAQIFDPCNRTSSQGDLVVIDGRVVEVGTKAELYNDDSVVDCSGKLILPGLIDCHVHFMVDGNFGAGAFASTPFSYHFYAAAERMRRTLDVGITSVREAGGSDLGVKEAQEDGRIVGPKMRLAITILSQTGGHGDRWEVCGAQMPGLLSCHPGRPDNVTDGPEEMRKKVREVIRAGAGVIKVCTSGGVLSPRDDPQHAHFRDEELKVLVAEATAAHLHVMAHAQATDGIKAAVRCGIRSIEHGIYLDDEAIEMMLDAGTYLVPTLLAPQGIIDLHEAGVEVPAYALEKTRQVVEVHRESIAKAVSAGVKIAMGTDSGVTPHGLNLKELELMVEAGMTSPEVLAAATIGSATLMGWEDEVGSLRPGKAADLVILSGTDLSVTKLGERIEAVYQDGLVR